MNNISIIVAHPDDETIGCGGTILKLLAAKKKVNLLTLSDGISSRSISNKSKKIRTNNFKNVLKSYKFNHTKNLNFPDNAFDSVPLIEIIKSIETFINYTKTDTIFTHFPSDLNIDHQITSRATVTASRPQPGQKIKNILFFEVLSSTDWSIDFKKFNPNYFEDISKFIKDKTKILKLYKDEIRNEPHTRSLTNIIRLSELRGNSVGIKNAEAFEIFRAMNIQKF